MTPTAGSAGGNNSEKSDAAQHQTQSSRAKAPFSPKSTSSKPLNTLGTRRSYKALAIIACLACVLLVLVCSGFAALSRRNNSNDSYYINIEKQFLKKKKQTGFHQSPCDCYSNDARRDCCERTIWRAHKSGTILLGDLFDQFRHSTARSRIRTKAIPSSENYTLPVGMDYRHVVVTRNWFDAIVSGYLYHKAGMECTMDYRGSKRESKNRTDDDWDMQLEYHDMYDVPPRNNRSFCAYLQDESEEDGMKVVIDIALSKWYKGEVPYHEKAKRKFKQDHWERSMFLCYEDLVDPFQQEAIFHHILAFMFPGRNTTHIAIPTKMKASLKQQQLNHSVYAGGHASTHDPELRARLRAMVEQYDRELFNNTIARSSAVFGCGQDKS